jgi:hypothetical protein
MKKFLKNSWILPMVALAFVMTSCGGGSSYWEGEATTPAEKIAQKACDCMATTMKSAGVDLDKLMAMDTEAMMKDAGTLSEEEMKKKYADFETEIGKLEKVEMRDVACAKDIEKESEEQKVEKSDMRKAMKEKCKLSKIM